MLWLGQSGHYVYFAPNTVSFASTERRPVYVSQTYMKCNNYAANAVHLSPGPMLVGILVLMS